MLFRKKYKSQFQQDRFLDRHIFQKKKNGFFVDVGAYDGVTYSNTFFFEKFRGWRGICLEPNPAIFPVLARNRSSVNINSCAGQRNEMVDFFMISGYSDMLSGIVKNYDEKHLNRIETEISVHGGLKKIIKVQCMNLNELLLNQAVQKIDYLSLDTEGNEMEIIESLDLNRIWIKAISVENNYHNHSIQEYLVRYGYDLIKVFECDELYVRKGIEK